MLMGQSQSYRRQHLYYFTFLVTLIVSYVIDVCDIIIGTLPREEICNINGNKSVLLQDVIVHCNVKIL